MDGEQVTPADLLVSQLKRVRREATIALQMAAKLRDETTDSSTAEEAQDVRPAHAD